MKEYVVRELNAIIRYHDIYGPDTAILFIHGLGCASSMDYPQVANSTELFGYRKILVDLLGSGFSDKINLFGYSVQDHANYLYELIKYLDFTDFIIYGHSMGGAIAIALAALAKDRIRGIILGEANLDKGGGFFSKKIASYDEQYYVKEGHQELINESIATSNTIWSSGLSNSSPVAIYRESQSLMNGQNPSWREILYLLDIYKVYIFGEQSLPDPDFNVLKGHGINVEILGDSGHSMAWQNPIGLSKLINKNIHLTKTSIRTH